MSDDKEFLPPREDYSLLCAITEAADRIEAEIEKTGEALSLVYAADDPNSLMRAIVGYGEANFALGEAAAEFNRLIERTTDPEHVAEVAAIADRIQASISRSYDAFVGAMRGKTPAMETTESLENGVAFFDSATAKNPDLLPGEGAIVRQLITTFAAGLDRAFGQIEAIKTGIVGTAEAYEERFKLMGIVHDKFIEAIQSLEGNASVGPAGTLMVPRAEWEEVQFGVSQVLEMLKRENLLKRIADLERQVSDLEER